MEEAKTPQRISPLSPPSGKDEESAVQPSSPMPLTAMCETWRARSGGGGPNQSNKQNQNQNQTTTHETLPSPDSRKQNTQTSAPKTTLATTTTSCIKNTHCRDTVFSNAKDEPKMKKQQQQRSLFAHLLQFVRFAPSQGAVYKTTAVYQPLLRLLNVFIPHVCHLCSWMLDQELKKILG